MLLKNFFLFFLFFSFSPLSMLQVNRSKDSCHSLAYATYLLCSTGRNETTLNGRSRRMKRRRNKNYIVGSKWWSFSNSFAGQFFFYMHLQVKAIESFSFFYLKLFLSFHSYFQFIYAGCVCDKKLKPQKLPQLLLKLFVTYWERRKVWEAHNSKNLKVWKPLDGMRFFIFM